MDRPPRADAAADDTGRFDQVALVAAVAAGGAVGTLGRYAIGRALVDHHRGFDWPTFVANVVGAFVLGAAVVYFIERVAPGHLSVPFVTVGMLGSFTTFSSWTVHAAQLIRDGRTALALGYLAVTMAAGLVAVAAGTVLARRLLGPPGARC